VTHRRSVSAGSRMHIRHAPRVDPHPPHPLTTIHSSRPVFRYGELSTLACAVGWLRRVQLSFFPEIPKMLPVYDGSRQGTHNGAVALAPEPVRRSLPDGPEVVLEPVRWMWYTLIAERSRCARDTETAELHSGNGLGRRCRARSAPRPDRQPEPGPIRCASRALRLGARRPRHPVGR
jgi:hypothetical protein